MIGFRDGSRMEADHSVHIMYILASAAHHRYFGRGRRLTGLQSLIMCHVSPLITHNCVGVCVSVP
jgi:hypothetical protein